MHLCRSRISSCLKAGASAPTLLHPPSLRVQRVSARPFCQAHDSAQGSAACLAPTPRVPRRDHSRQVAAQFRHTEQRRSTLIPTTTAASSHRIRVAVDVDEVLGRFLYSLNQFCKEKYGMEHDVSDYWVYEFAKIWNCNQDHSNHIVHEFFKSDHFNQGIPAIPGAYEALQRMSEAYDLVVVTSRQHVIQDQTLDWIDRNYPGIFHEVYFGNHWSLEGVSRKKSDICRAVGASVMIDDNTAYATECAAAGIHVFLYDWNHSYPWSKLPPSASSDPFITIVRDWSDVEQQLAALAPRILATNNARSGSGLGHASSNGVHS